MRIIKCPICHKLVREHFLVGLFVCINCEHIFQQNDRIFLIFNDSYFLPFLSIIDYNNFFGSVKT